MATGISLKSSNESFVFISVRLQREMCAARDMWQLLLPSDGAGQGTGWGGERSMKYAATQTSLISGGVKRRGGSRSSGMGEGRNEVRLIICHCPVDARPPGLRWSLTPASRRFKSAHHGVCPIKYRRESFCRSENRFREQLLSSLFYIPACGR